ncbi:MAG: hypothetical protein QM723_35450 [Myxococcaceae bacterium]
MQKMMALVALAAFAVASVAFAMNTTQQVRDTVDDAKVNQVIDSRLHELLLKADMSLR